MIAVVVDDTTECGSIGAAIVIAAVIFPRGLVGKVLRRASLIISVGYSIFVL